MKPETKPPLILVAIKLLHTGVWLFFASCIAAIPVAASLQRFKIVAILAGLVLGECLVIGLNHGRCPLTDLAAGFTPETSDNFDIYLPNWLARHNKMIFGALFVVGGVYSLVRWLSIIR